ncbi:MAG: hypothetical protein ACT4PZ_16870 [Panacagrimonas sp.]
MPSASILLTGLPGMGKTNYLARLWASFRRNECRIGCSSPPSDIKYVEEALAFLLGGDFAPRSDPSLEDDRGTLRIPLTFKDGNAAAVDLVVPDVIGELWKKAVANSEISTVWHQQLTNSCGALLFVQVRSEETIAPLDWVSTHPKLMKQAGKEGEEAKIPTQVALCQLLRFLEQRLTPRAGTQRAKVAVVITAWDMLDAQASARGPRHFLEEQFPLFSGKLSVCRGLDIALFGTSVVGGDLSKDPKFRDAFLEKRIEQSGFVVDAAGQRHDDITLPVAWLIED